MTSSSNKALGLEAGFSLMELLVSLSVLALMASLLTGGLQFGTRVWENTAQSTQELEERRTTRLLLSHLLQRSYPYWYDTAVSASEPSFIGERNEVVFSAEAPIQFAVQGLYRFRLLEDQTRGTDGELVLHWVIDRNGKNDVRTHASAKSRTLIRNLASFQISYFDGKLWGDRWTAKNELPELVKLEIVTNQGGLWPPIIVHPIIDRDSQCQFDPISRRCRPR